MKSFYVALGFLTAVPVKTPPLTSGDLGRAGLFFPLIGLGLGIVLCVAQYFLVQLFSPVIAAALLVSMWAAVTGVLNYHWARARVEVDWSADRASRRELWREAWPVGVSISMAATYFYIDTIMLRPMLGEAAVAHRDPFAAAPPRRIRGPPV